MQSAYTASQSLIQHTLLHTCHRHQRDLLLLCHALQVDYVRVHKQLQCLQQLRQGAAALSVALPGSEGRNLHSHSQNQKRVDKLFDRLGSLATKLDLAAPLQPSSSDYIRGLSLLRDEEISTLQMEIEKLVAGLQVLKFDRQQAGAASCLTRSQRKMATSKRKRVQQLVSVMQTWQQLQLPGSSVTAPLPANWSEADISQLFKGIYPWQQGSNAVLGAVTKIMAERFRDACAEVTLQPVIAVCCKLQLCILSHYF